MDDYVILNKIGDGTFGTVYKCRKLTPSSNKLNALNDNKHHQVSHNDTSTGVIVAIKKMKQKYYNWEDCIKSREIQILKKINHVNIISLMEVIRESDNNLYLVFEHMEENLHQLISNRSYPFPEDSIISIVSQIARGLDHIHRKGFFHRDIKPENILCRNGYECIKIADFGLIREINSQPPFTEYISTRWYRAPELLLRSKQYSWSVDIWALGCLTGELYILNPIFPGRSEIDQIFKICQTIGPPSVENWPDGPRLASVVQFNFPNIHIGHLKLSNLITNCSDIGLSLITSLLKWNPNERPPVSDILNHKFFER